MKLRDKSFPMHKVDGDVGVPGGRARLAKAVKATGGPTEAEAEPYRAPAAEKTLDILEYMAATQIPLTQSQIAAGVGRSIHEVYRIIQLMERRRYLERDPKSDRYSLTLHLFSLAHSTPRIRTLSEAAIGPMRRLADTIQQSCHLAVLTGVEVTIVCQVDSPLSMRYSVSVGARFPAHQTSSGLVLLAGLPEEQRRRVLIGVERHLAEGESMQAVKSHLSTVQDQGHDVRPSLVVSGVTNVSFPIFDMHAQTIAVLTVPFLPMKTVATSLEEATRATAEAADEISLVLGHRKAIAD
ncbi:IclR family transcriptional regulator [Labrys neptuniae]